MDRDAGRLQVVLKLRVPVEPLGEVGVVAVDENGRAAAIGRLGREHRVDSCNEGAFVGEPLRRHNKEIGPGVGR